MISDANSNRSGSAVFSVINLKDIIDLFAFFEFVTNSKTETCMVVFKIKLMFLIRCGLHRFL
jgi:hypothetical protein